jgi:hypothetical protein
MNENCWQKKPVGAMSHELENQLRALAHGPETEIAKPRQDFRPSVTNHSRNKNRGAKMKISSGKGHRI